MFGILLLWNLAQKTGLRSSMLCSVQPTTNVIVHVIGDTLTLSFIVCNRNLCCEIWRTANNDTNGKKKKSEILGQVNYYHYWFLMVL